MPRQRGSFLLEALVAILIVAFGILGLLGLEARALQNVDDAQYRSEAVALANSYIGQMWVADQTTLAANFDSTPQARARRTTNSRRSCRPACPAPPALRRPP